ncbi:hypothetical protein SIID45300_03012 [Candidatus Magnetaquicoccaceae bacterium FCR-1]|uniref:Uncharacterized protein n=1 Tax=Candidatus Magnetaquiglobus chichijimensis TaxID=3141448 RepID=A0ABQ0CCP7_9PROT
MITTRTPSTPKHATRSPSIQNAAFHPALPQARRATREEVSEMIMKSPFLIGRRVLGMNMFSVAA